MGEQAARMSKRGARRQPAAPDDVRAVLREPGQRRLAAQHDAVATRIPRTSRASSASSTRSAATTCATGSARSRSRRTWSVPSTSAGAAVEVDGAGRTDPGRRADDARACAAHGQHRESRVVQRRGDGLRPRALRPPSRPPSDPAATLPRRPGFYDPCADSSTPRARPCRCAGAGSRARVGGRRRAARSPTASTLVYSADPGRGQPPDRLARPATGWSSTTRARRSPPATAATRSSPRASPATAPLARFMSVELGDEDDVATTAGDIGDLAARSRSRASRAATRLRGTVDENLLDGGAGHGRPRGRPRHRVIDATLTFGGSVVRDARGRRRSRHGEVRSRARVRRVPQRPGRRAGRRQRRLRRAAVGLHRRRRRRPRHRWPPTA